MNSYILVLNRMCEEVQQNMANKQKDTESIEWDVNVEILLFYAMIGHKPVGVNRNFMMLCIHQRFSTFLNRQISSKVIWDHLDSMYDMAALHESEDLPFSKEEVDFDLPKEYDELIATKYGVKREHQVIDNEQSKNSNSAKVSKKLNTPKLKQNSVSLPNKNEKLITKNVTKSNGVENNSKVKTDVTLSKTQKVRHNSSTFPSKSIKNEPNSVKKDESDGSYKKLKPERCSSPANTKKSSKTEVSNTPANSKKSTKEQNSLTVKHKFETPDNNTKKVKSEKEMSNKKGKISTLNDNNKKNIKVDNNNDSKKKNETEHSTKKNDLAASKQKSVVKNSNITNKGSRVNESHAAVVTGSRKSSTTKTVVNDSAKKGKRQKTDESTKKGTSTTKRRRT